MVLISMNPMIHGFAVEGIIEGTQVCLWDFGCGQSTTINVRGVSFGCLILLSNWYWSVVWAIVGVISQFQNRKVWGWMLVSIVLCLPWIGHFVSIQGNGFMITADIYRAMGFDFTLPIPTLYESL